MTKHKKKLYGLLFIAIYVFFDISFRKTPMSDEYGFLGVVNILPIIYGLMLSYMGALYVFIGSLLADFLTADQASLAKAIASASVPAVAFALWVRISGERTMKTFAGLLRFLLISAVSSIVSSVIFSVFYSLEHHRFSIQVMLITFLSFFLWQLLFSAPVISALLSLFFVFPENLETFSRYAAYSKACELSFENMGMLVQNITTYCKSHGLDSRKIYYIPMCIEEILLYLKDNNTTSNVEISFAVSDAVYIRIMYDGSPLNPFARKISMQELENDFSLLGIKIVKELAIKIRHKCVDRNVLEIIL